ncbi:hypothetical protein BS17DRAFT_357310 [Gyrodon lividus]|nr:hypothetical protein BS17DRAFT_357310 [Gyrodon lividus]
MMSANTTIPLSNLEKWLAGNASPADNWSAKLWEHTWRFGLDIFTRCDVKRPDTAQRASVDIPKQCIIAPGFGEELRTFNTRAIFVRPEYCIILDRMMALLQDRDVDDVEEDTDVVMEQIDPFSMNIPDNPFKSPDFINRKHSFIISGSPGNGFYLVGAWTIVQATSPRTDQIYWSTKTHYVHQLCMAPFTLVEALVARTCQTLLDLDLPSERELEKWYQLYTPSLRPAFYHAKQRQLKEYERRITAQCYRTGASSMSELALDVRSKADFKDELPHEIFVHFPNNSRLLSTSRVVVPTNHLSELVLSALDGANLQARLKTYATWKDIPGIASPCGVLFEQLAKFILPLGGSFLLRELEVHDTKHVNCHWGVPAVSGSTTAKYLIIDGNASPPLRTQGTKEEIPVSHRMTAQRYAKIDDITGDGFYFPETTTQPTLDFLYMQRPTAYLFQCTTAASHPVKPGGLASLKKLGISNVIFIGVVPKGRTVKFVIEKKVADEFTFISGRYLLDFDPTTLDLDPTTLTLDPTVSR